MSRHRDWNVSAKVAKVVVWSYPKVNLNANCYAIFYVGITVKFNWVEAP